MWRIRLDSALLLGWAPGISYFSLVARSYNLPGLVKFVQVASSQNQSDSFFLSMHCDDSLQAAQAGSLLSACSGQVSMQLRGSHIPDSFPMQLVALEMSFSPQSNQPLSCNALEVFISRLACLRALRSLKFACLGPRIRLVSPLNLPELEVSLSFCLATDSVLDLSWLRHQPCSRLSVDIRITTGLPSLHQRVTEQLLPLRLHSLCLQWQVPFLTHLQRMWHRISPCQALELLVGFPAPALQFLPRSVKTSISEGCRFGGAAEADLLLGWAAVSSHAGSFSLFTEYASRVCILDAPSTGCSNPTGIEGPWQLKIRTSSLTTSVLGLQGLQARGRVRYLQNDAATAAGWTV